MGCGLTSVLLCVLKTYGRPCRRRWTSLGLATSRYGLRTNSSPHSLANVQLQLDIRRNQATFVPELEKSRQIKSKRRPFQIKVQMHVFIQSFQNLFTHCGKGLTQPLGCGQLLYLVGSSLSHSTSPQDAVFQPRAPLASMLPKLYSVQLSCETKRMTQQHV